LRAARRERFIPLQEEGACITRPYGTEKRELEAEIDVTTIPLFLAIRNMPHLQAKRNLTHTSVGSINFSRGIGSNCESLRMQRGLYLLNPISSINGQSLNRGGNQPTIASLTKRASTGFERLALEVFDIRPTACGG